MRAFILPLSGKRRQKRPSASGVFYSNAASGRSATLCWSLKAQMKYADKLGALYPRP